MQCEACGGFFKREKKGYNRYGTTIQVNGQSIQSLLEQYSVPRQASRGKAFVCSACFSQLRTITKHEAMFLEGVKRKVGPAFMVNFIFNDLFCLHAVSFVVALHICFQKHSINSFSIFVFASKTWFSSSASVTEYVHW